MGNFKRRLGLIMRLGNRLMNDWKNRCGFHRISHIRDKLRLEVSENTLQNVPLRLAQHVPETLRYRLSPSALAGTQAGCIAAIAVPTLRVRFSLKLCLTSSTGRPHPCPFAFVVLEVTNPSTPQ